MVTGGGAMHLNDSFGKSEKIRCICNHHEQACAIAAEGYARQKNALAVVNVTTGPGGLNTLNGVFGQFTDSVPVLYVSGQVRLDTTVFACPELNLRQLGDQEVRIVDVVKPVTKYAVMVTDPNRIRIELEKAISQATKGRPGPVWVDVPMNIQGANIDELTLESYIAEEPFCDLSSIVSDVETLSKWVKRAERPIFVAGYGVRLSGMTDLFKQLLDRTGIPVLSTLNGFDIMESDNPNSIGTIGSIGSRAGNFALQNADLVIYLGTRNNIRQVSYNWPSVARTAKKVCVDIDKAELLKPLLKYDLSICANLKDFLPLLSSGLTGELPDYSDWLKWCIERKNRYSAVLESYKDLKSCVNPYYFMQQLSEVLPENSTVVTGNATACICYFQAAKVKKGQHVIWNSGCASMGYDLPAAIGVAVAGSKQVICLAGDGSLQMNIQELMTMSYYKFPIKLFYLNNGGYISMKQTQDNFFGRRIGADEKSGVAFPDISKLATAFDLKFLRIASDENIADQITKVISIDGPLICEVMLPTEYIFAPKLSSERKPDGRIVTKPMEDMFPFLNREEFMENMIVPVVEE